MDTRKQEMRAEADASAWAPADGVGWAVDGTETRLGAIGETEPVRTANAAGGYGDEGES